MAKKKSATAAAATAQSKKEETAAAAEDEVPTAQAAYVGGGDEEEELELLQVDTGDMVKVKQILDEAVSAALLEQSDCRENTAWDNLKLTVMFVSCLCAAAAQFVPIPFPESRPVLGACCAAYFVLSGTLQLLTTLVDRDTVLWTLPVAAVAAADGGSGGAKNRDMSKYGLRVYSSLPRFSEWYTVGIQFHLPGKEAKEGKKKASFVEQTWSLGQFFDKEGYFDEAGLTEQIDKLYNRFCDGKYDTVSQKDKKKKE
jgi:signal peptidase complex subunit 2